MTFTIVGRCRRTGHFGIGIATSSPAVSSRCTFVSRDGAVAFQSVPDPRLGALGLRMIEQGWSAQKIVDELVATDTWPGKRQIGIVDRDGRSAAYTGDANVAWAGHLTGQDFVAMGNVLAGPEVAEAMASEFAQGDSEELEERLLRAIEAGRDAGGQEEGQTSAGLLTFGHHPFSRCDLRVDVHEEPIAELRRIYDWYRPLVPYYVERGINPNVPRVKEYLSQQGIERDFGRPVPVTRGPKAGQR